MFALREKEIFQNEHLQKSLRGKRQPTDAVRPQSLHEGASSLEKPQTGKDVFGSAILVCSGTIMPSMSYDVIIFHSIICDCYATGF